MNARVGASGNSGKAIVATATAVSVRDDVGAVEGRIGLVAGGRHELRAGTTNTPRERPTSARPAASLTAVPQKVSPAGTVAPVGTGGNG